MKHLVWCEKLQRNKRHLVTCTIRVTPSEFIVSETIAIEVAANGGHERRVVVGRSVRDKLADVVTTYKPDHGGVYGLVMSAVESFCHLKQ